LSSFQKRVVFFIEPYRQHRNKFERIGIPVKLK